MATAYGVVPRYMTTEDPWDNEGQDVEHQQGHALRYDFTGYLSRTYYGMQMDERLSQLEEIDWRCWKAHTLKQRRRSVKDIAGELRCSLATAYNLLAKAREYLEAGVREHDDYEAKLTMLEIQDPQALRVYVGMDAGYSQQQLANLMDVPLDTVKHASIKAQKFLGVHRRDVLVKRYRDLALAGT